ncbi:hypothetical protein V6N11_069286 [Hibiscus sabdariffa]|uniref:Uncharacterized protein n=1 Tax=Hibiscus sabdariffa TaxID=183260 RepID=A0ABR1ZVJ5_9ROSI
MKARVATEARPFYGMNSVDLWAVGKMTVEWDLNDWKWDGELFIASSINQAAYEMHSKAIICLCFESCSSTTLVIFMRWDPGLLPLPSISRYLVTLVAKGSSLVVGLLDQVRRESPNIELTS